MQAAHSGIWFRSVGRRPDFNAATVTTIGIISHNAMKSEGGFLPKHIHKPFDFITRTWNKEPRPIDTLGICIDARAGKLWLDIPAPLSGKSSATSPGLPPNVDGAPSGYVGLLALPADIAINWLPRPESDMDFVHLFTASASGLKTKLQSYRKKIAPAGVIWLSWPKKSSGVETDVTEDSIREVALLLGLVDIKVLRH
jgi:hypothetical protein